MTIPNTAAGLERLSEQQRADRDYLDRMAHLLDPQRYRSPMEDTASELVAALLDYLADDTDPTGGADAQVVQEVIEDAKRWLERREDERAEDRRRVR